MASIFYAALAAAVYGIIFYFKQHMGSSPESFDPTKFFSTVILSIIIGATTVYFGNPVTEADIALQLVAYAGYIVIIENILKVLYRYMNRGT